MDERMELAGKIDAQWSAYGRGHLTFALTPTEISCVLSALRSAPPMTKRDWEHYNKLLQARAAALEEVTRAYAVWSDSTARLKRIETQLHDDWMKRLEEAYLAPPPPAPENK